jgi:preprotein translocase subunit SecE
MTQARETEPSARPATAAGGRGSRRPGPGTRLATYNRQVVAELRKVIWPTRNELVTYSVVSITFVAVMVAIVGALDYGFTKLVFSVFS